MAESGGFTEELDRIVEVVSGVDTSKYLADRWVALGLEGGPRGSALAVVRPKTEAEVAAVVRLCAARGAKITCRGGGSSVTGASAPFGAVVVDMSAMDKILSVDEQNMSVWAEAGAKLSEVEAALNARGYTLGQVPQSFHLATVGGYLSTMGTGEYSGACGGAEDSVLSLRVVLADGTVADTRPTDAPRTSVGPDTTRLFVGAEGSFGIVVAAKLKMYSVPRHTVKLAYRFESFEEALSAAKRLLELDVSPAVCRVYDGREASYMFGQTSPLMLLIYHFRSEKIAGELAAEARELLAGVGGGELDVDVVDRWLDTRFRYDEQLAALRAAGYIVETAELGSSWSELAALYSDACSMLGSVEGVAGFGAHVSHIYRQGACLYFTVILKPNIETYRALWRALAEACSAHGATVSHHHGVGALKAEAARKEAPYTLLSKIKGALDPEGLFNPGKLL